MELQIKSKSAKRILDQLENFDQEAFSKRVEEENLGNMVIAEGLLLGYLDSFFTIIAGRGIQLDMTYQTVDRLPTAIAELYIFHRMGGVYQNEPVKRIGLVEKTLAAYLTLLAMNEHGYSMRVRDYLSDLRKGKKPEYPLWAEMFSIMTGPHADVDLLPSCVIAHDRTGIYVSRNGLRLNAEPIVEVYRFMSNVNLTKYGFTNIEAK